MNTEDYARPPRLPSSINDEERSADMQPTNAELPRFKIESLLTEVDKLALHLRQKIAELLTEEEAIRQITNKKDSLENLVVQLREANQNLVLATFGAQDRQAQAEATYRRQEEFLSMLAHELRNPLAPVSMAAEFLGTITHAHPQLPKLHEIICRQTNHLTRLVEDLMDASRVNNGKITLKKSALLISEVIESAVETSKPFIDKRHQNLTVELPLEPVVIMGDLVRLVQVFSNLLINATKFTPECGKIVLSVSHLAGTVAVSVKDDGVGIPLDLQPFIFDLFTQGPRSLDRSQGGMGIGLSLVRSIAKMHGGFAQVISAGVGLGSEFLVTLPVCDQPPFQGQASTPDVGPSALINADRPRRILLIEDNADGNEILSKLLTLHGHIAESAYNGNDGLEMAVSKMFDVIICDVGLPGLNGYEVVKQLRQLSVESVPLLIAMTGYNQESHRARAMEAGFDHYLVKPIVAGELIKLIASRIP